MPPSIQKQIADLCKRAQTEHHEYEVSVLNGVRDEEWDMWYAAWLIEHGLNDLLNSDMQSADLATLLADINTQHQGADPQKDWADYTAEQLIETVA